MLYAILIYGSEAHVETWTADHEAAVLGRHAALRQELAGQGRLGPALRLQKGMSTVIKGARGGPVILDGPFAETKEQLMGIYVIECATLEEAIEAAQRLDFETAVFEVRPITQLEPGVLCLQSPASKK